MALPAPLGAAAPLPLLLASPLLLLPLLLLLPCAKPSGGRRCAASAARTAATTTSSGRPRDSTHDPCGCRLPAFPGAPPSLMVFLFAGCCCCSAAAGSGAAPAWAPSSPPLPPAAARFLGGMLQRCCLLKVRLRTTGQPGGRGRTLNKPKTRGAEGRGCGARCCRVQMADRSNRRGWTCGKGGGGRRRAQMEKRSSRSWVAWHPEASQCICTVLQSVSTVRHRDAGAGAV